MKVGRSIYLEKRKIFRRKMNYVSPRRNLCEETRKMRIMGRFILIFQVII